jgi:hypothetical protein
VISTAVNTFTTNQIISGSTTADLLRVTQTGSGNALVVEDEANPDSTPFVIAADGKLIHGHTAQVDVGGFTPITQLHHTGAGFGLYRWSANATHATTFVAKSRGSSVGSYTSVSASDGLYALNVYGADGTSFVQAAQISAVVDSAPSTGIVPGRLIFSTASSAGTLTERMRIDSAGQVGIGGTPAAGRTLAVSKTITGSTTSIAVLSSGTIQSDVTTEVASFRSNVNTAAASFTLAVLSHYHVVPSASAGSGSTITSQFGFNVASTMTGATNNYGFFGDIGVGTGRWNLYMGGTAANYMAGRLGVGATLTTGSMAQITNTTAGDIVFIVKGAASQTGNLEQWQNSAGTVLEYVAADGSSSFYEGDQNLLAASIFS